MSETDNRSRRANRWSGLSTADRFWMKVDWSEDKSRCWVWLGFKGKDGYGYFWAGKRAVRAHRWAYQDRVGPIPNEMQLDHLCRVRHCVNPSHLEPVTQRENHRRGMGGELRTHCKHGHEYNEVNTYVTKQGVRVCRICRRKRQKEWDLQNKIVK